MSVDKKINYKDQRLTKDQQKKIKPVVQAGTKNFLGKQKMVTVPKKWLSSSDHVVAELAYITPREQKILLDANLYESLNGQPNRGPGGIMSLQGAGDGGGSGDKGTNDDGSNNPGYDVQADLTDYATNVGKTAKSTGGFKGDGFFGGVVDTVKDYVLGGGIIGMGLRGLNKAFGGPKSKDTVEMYGPEGKRSGPMAPGRDITNVEERDGEGNRDLYAATNQYTAPTPVEEEGITTMVDDPNFIQRFMVKEPYRQAKGLDFLAQNQGIANMINNLYT